MAKFFGKESRYMVLRLWIAVFGAIAYMVIGYWTLYNVLFNYIKHPYDPIFLLSLFIVYGPLLFYIRREFKKMDIDASKFFKGLKGEKSVGEKLQNELPDEYSIYADLIINPRYGNIDYVVVGPTGIFAIEVKSHKGIIDFNGSQLTRDGHLFEKNFLKQAKSEALSVNHFLIDKLNVKIFIKPIIVFSDRAQLHFGTKPVDNVYVIQKSWLADIIKSMDLYHYQIERDKIEDLLKTLVVTISPLKQ